MPTGFTLSGQSISSTYSRLVQSNTSTFEALDGLGDPYTNFNISGSLSAFTLSAGIIKTTTLSAEHYYAKSITAEDITSTGQRLNLAGSLTITGDTVAPEETYSLKVLSPGLSLSATQPFIILTGGNVGIGIATPGTKLEVAGSISAQSITTQNIYPSADVTYDLGSPTKRYSAVHLGSDIHYANALSFVQSDVTKAYMLSDGSFYTSGSVSSDGDFIPAQDAVKKLGRSDKRFSDIYLASNVHYSNALSFVQSDVTKAYMLSDGSFYTSGSVSSDGDFIPAQDAVKKLGRSDKRFSDIYLASNVHFGNSLSFVQSDVTKAYMLSDGSLYTSGSVSSDGDFIPAQDAVKKLGRSDKRFSDIYLASNIHYSNALSFVQNDVTKAYMLNDGSIFLSGSVSSDGDFIPAKTAVSKLGRADKRFSDIYLASNIHSSISGLNFLNSIGDTVVEIKEDGNMLMSGGVSADTLSSDTVHYDNSLSFVQNNATKAYFLNDGTLSIQGSLSAEKDFIPAKNAVSKLGKSDKRFTDLYLNSNIHSGTAGLNFLNSIEDTVVEIKEDGNMFMSGGVSADTISSDTVHYDNSLSFVQNNATKAYILNDGSLFAQGSVSAEGDFIPAKQAVSKLGRTDKRFTDIYLASTIHGSTAGLNFTNDAEDIVMSLGTTGDLTISGNLVGATTSTNIGTTSKPIHELYVSSGSINFVDTTRGTGDAQRVSKFTKTMFDKLLNGEPLLDNELGESTLTATTISANTLYVKDFASLGNASDLPRAFVGLAAGTATLQAVQSSLVTATGSNASRLTGIETATGSLQTQLNTKLSSEGGDITGRVINRLFTFESNNSQPSVKNGNMFVTGNKKTTSYSIFKDGKEGQSITIIIKDKVTEFAQGGGQKELDLYLNLGVTYTAQAGDVISFVCDGKNWFEVNRSVNTAAGR